MKKIVVPMLCLAAVSALAFAGWRMTRPRNKNVVFLMMDTTRADHLGVFGYPRETSKNIDQFARENVRFSYAVTAAPWTPPAVATMFTGLYPASHGCVPPNGKEAAREAGAKLSGELLTLAEIFKQHGYSTGGVSSNPWITEEFGFNQGFDSYWYKARIDAGKVNEAGKGMVENFLQTGKPFFLYLHYLDPHTPYKAPEKYKTHFSGSVPGTNYAPETQAQINQYDGEIRYMDERIGELFAYFKEKGIYDDLSIVLVADHGEQFMERGHQGHGFNLYDEEVHVPFIVKEAGSNKPRVVETTVNTVDLFPTVLSMAGILPPSAVAGISLLDEKALSERRGVFSEIVRKLDPQRAFTTGDGMKLIVQDSPERGEHVIGVFNSRRDPQEANPIQDQELVMTLNNELQEVRQFAMDGRVHDETARGQLKESTVEQLKTLGYLQ